MKSLLCAAIIILSIATANTALAERVAYLNGDMQRYCRQDVCEIFFVSKDKAGNKNKIVSYGRESLAHLNVPYANRLIEKKAELEKAVLDELLTELESQK